MLADEGLPGSAGTLAAHRARARARVRRSVLASLSSKSALVGWLALATSACGGDDSSDGKPSTGGSGGAGGTAATGGKAGAGGSSGGSAGTSGLGLGLLPLRVQHNLATDACVATNSCTASVEVDDGLPAFLERVAAETTMPVLHWDRAIPWLAFVDDAPSATERVSFYDAKLDAGVKAYVEAFATAFAARPGGYLALTPLHGSRDRIKPLRYDAAHPELPVGTACQTIDPSTIASADLSSVGQGTKTFDLAKTFRNFVLYMHDKLKPGYLAILIEGNLFAANCPAQWAGLAAFYRATYDAVRAEVPASVQIFATLTLTELLGYSLDTCYGGYDLTPCTEAPGNTYPTADTNKCFPLVPNIITDLDQGDRLDVLALSIYPDGWGMVRPGLEDALVEAFTVPSKTEGACFSHGKLAPYVDPLAEIKRFGWTKPIAVAETGARSCPVVAWFDNPDPTKQFLVRVGGTPPAEASWIQQVLATAQTENWAFVTYSFLDQYPAMGPWIPATNTLDSFTFNAFNAFPCMGLYDETSQPKTAARDAWRAALP